jgi:DNA-directed RNA polymerase alpha subunit
MNEKCKKIFEEMEMLVPTADFMEIKKQRNGKLKFPIYINEKIKTTELELLELSVRSSNCLRRAGFKTVGELVEVIEGSEDLRKIRNCGSKSVDEIMEQLFCYQYCQLDTPQKIKYVNKLIDLN